MSKIQWTEKTWNPVTGCSRVSAGCQNCYAERMAWRLMNNPVVGDRYAGTVRKTEKGRIQWTGKVNLIYDAITQPYTWRKPSLVFVNSMSDFFHPDIPQKFLGELWRVMRDTPQHTYQILTKRPQNITDRLPADWGDGYPNVWLGTSVEDLATAKLRILHLSMVNAAVRFLSMEPLLNAVDLSSEPLWDEWLYPDYAPVRWLDWVIVGGESGPNSRECNPIWIKDILDQCQPYEVPVFVKQLGTVTAKEYSLKDRKGGNINEWPLNLRVREYPKTYQQNPAAHANP